MVNFSSQSLDDKFLTGILPMEESWSAAASDTLSQFLNSLLTAQLKNRSGDVFDLQLTQTRQDESGVVEISVADHLVAAGVVTSQSSAGQC
jgi:hypothetical protein